MRPQPAPNETPTPRLSRATRRPDSSLRRPQGTIRAFRSTLAQVAVPSLAAVERQRAHLPQALACLPQR